MKKIILSILLIFNSCFLFAQYGNEWIDYNRAHFPIKVSEEGIYRISSNLLNNVGLNFISPQNFRLFRNGKQVPIYINANGNTINYIEFYGYPNDGEADTPLYRDEDWQPHTLYSLFSDDAIYYLTYNNVGNNMRINDINNDLANLPAKEEFFMHEEISLFTNTFSAGQAITSFGAAIRNSIFAKGEGFFGNNSHQFNNSTQIRNFSLSTPFKYNNGPNAQLKTVVIGTTTGPHNYQVKIDNTVLSSHQFVDYDMIKSDDIVQISLINNSTTVTFQSIPTTSGLNRNTPSLIIIKYPRIFNFGNESEFEFKVEANGLRQYLEIQNFNALGIPPILYDITNGYRITSIDAAGSGTFRFVLPPAIGERQLYIRAGSNTVIKNVSSLTPIDFVNFKNFQNQGDYIILSHPSVMSSSRFQDYVSYRSSPLGGAYTVVAVDINQIYHQFGFGIDKSPLGISKFSSFAKNEWGIDPKFLFIMGNAREYNTFRTNQNQRDLCLIPTFGHPGSDNLLTSNLQSSVPQIPTGRLALYTTTTVFILRYLDKVKQYETELRNTGDPYQTIANKEYQKQILHFGGGTTQSQQTIFAGYMNNYKSMAEDTLWGANVQSVFKTSSSPLQSVQSELLRDRIDRGVSLVTFFGHSYAGGFDISFDEPENYTNVGKYPIFLANGCNAGLIHTNAQSISERFIFADQRGAIAYLSTADLSSSTGLNNFSSFFYKNLAKDTYNKTIGEVLQATINDVEDCCANFEPNMMVAHEMTLHGDPAIPFNQYENPDYAIEADKVYFSPNNITTSLDSFELLLDVFNLGKAVKDSFNIEVTRLLPNGSQEVLVKRFPATYYRDTFAFKFSVSEGFNGFGLNTFNIYVDVDNEISNEISESNNYLINQVQLIVGSDDIFPIYPYEFAIVPKQNIVLKASTGDPFAPTTSYTFQIDTSEIFNNPIAETQVVISGGVVEWQPPITMQDSTVYYWRVGSQSGIADNRWQYSSFIYIQDEFPGWNQSHYFQWKKNDFQNIQLDSDRKFRFVDDVKDVFVQTSNFFVSGLDFNEIKYEINGAKFHNWRMNQCAGGGGFPNGFTIAVINHLTGLPYERINNSGTNYGEFGNIHCSNVNPTQFVVNFRSFGNTPADHPSPGVPWSSLMLDFLNNISEDDYVIIYTINNARFDLMDPSVLNFLNSKGASVNTSTDGPMILAYKEAANQNVLAFELGTSQSDIISAQFTIAGTWNSGNFTSPLIGPALEWGSIHWRYSHEENPTQDEQSIDVFGSGGVGAETKLFTIQASTLDTMITFIDPVQYPFLRLRFLTSDDEDRTPTQPDYWRVLYKKPPELAINPNKYFEITADSVNQGAIWKVSVAVENVTEELAFDSLWTKYTSNFGNNTNEQFYKQYDSLPPIDTLHLSFDANTIDGKYIGENNLTIEANPLDNHHQLEQFHFNNFAQIKFYVIGDNENPLLDVTFDGIHILDGDIVSAKPEIQIQLKDENEYLALDDTSLINIYFRHISSNEMWRVNYTDINVNFYPAEQSNLSENNKATVGILAEFPKDGTYELIARSRDKSGNSSSSTEDRLQGLDYYDYKISFEVINQSSISNVLNYPNPFTSRTQFVFTLTGSEIPDYFEIQIMNVKGTVVKQIRMEEIGPINIGLNRSQYWWDGRDQYGDILANGVYFYRILSSIDNQDIDHYNIEQVDKFFKKGIGKMVMIR